MKDTFVTSALFLSVCIIWGTTWMAMEIAVESIPPIIATGLRFLISAPCILLLAKCTGAPLCFPKGQRSFMFAVAVFYFAIPFTLMIVGEQYISSGLASIIFANMPLAVLAISMLSLGLRLVPHQLIGLTVAILCLCLILNNELDIGDNNDYSGILALVAAVAIHAVMYVFTQKYGQGIQVLTYNALPSAIAAILLLVVGSIWEQPQWHLMETHSLQAVVYLGLIASVGGIVAYFRLNQVTSPFTASLCFLIFPVVALCLDAWLNNNHLSAWSQQLLAPLFLGIVVAKLNRFPSIRALVRSK
ncbi:DMT family transporter [Photobacterium sanguinicancri]|uniref:DMT family transporter n=1 Tax=Photobacterium sanguinicancri TaxID=875932 RepID=UPI0021C37452|nr:EamA family transporter [Photobacterium sanguinicancri]